DQPVDICSVCAAPRITKPQEVIAVTRGRTHLHILKRETGQRFSTAIQIYMDIAVGRAGQLNGEVIHMEGVQHVQSVTFNTAAIDTALSGTLQLHTSAASVCTQNRFQSTAWKIFIRHGNLNIQHTARYRWTGDAC